MQVILTRALHQQAHWAQGLLQQGWQVQSLPLIEISPAAQVEWPAKDVFQAVMFVSHNAVEHFFKPNPPLAGVFKSLFAINNIASNRHQPRFWATGPGTAQALQASGVPPGWIDCPSPDAGQFDSEALWHMVQPQVQQGTHVLIVRGRDVGTPDASRDWLAQRIEAAGGQASSLVVYERRAPALTAAQLLDAQGWLHDGSVWYFSSSQAIRHLPLCLDVSRARCVCTHERIAQAASARGFAVVCTSRPLLQDVVASIKSIV